MAILQVTSLRSALQSMQWRRGLRAAAAVGTGMLFCHFLHLPAGWVALGALQVIMVDNGGPYRSRFANIVAVLAGGSIAVLLGILAGGHLFTAIATTLIFCFLITLARVTSQPLASSSVVILICYIIANAATAHTLSASGASVLSFIAGGLWATFISVALWPADAFQPARLAVADVYHALRHLIELLPRTGEATGLQAFNEAVAQVRLRLEAAHESIAATPARMSARTVRSRNLSALVETADLIFARTLPLAETGNSNAFPNSPSLLPEIASWLSSALAPVEPALREPPPNNASAFAPDGSFSVDLRRSAPALESALLAHLSSNSEASAHLRSTLRDLRLSLEITFEAIRAIWTGAEPLRTAANPFRGARLSGQPSASATPAWVEALHANLTFRSVMFRHAVRLSAVVALEVLLMYFFRRSFARYTHGYWLAMTSLIVLQPYTGETVRKSRERVAGTVSGGLIAALIAALIPSELGIILAITVTTTFTIAIFTVDYALYCFFLTPTIVLMTMPHLHDWHFAAVRVGMTFLGTLIALLAMLLVWPERESLQLPGLLAAGASANAAYLRAVLAFWQQAATGGQQARLAAERAILAPARRACGLAANGAEEALDHALLEHAIPLNPARQSTGQLNAAALTYTSYLRRLTRSATNLAALQQPAPTPPDPAATRILPLLADRLDAVAEATTRHSQPVPAPADASPLWSDDLPDTLVGQQLRQLGRQVAVLEQTAGNLSGSNSASHATPA